MPFSMNQLASIPWQSLDTRPYTPGMFGGGPVALGENQAYLASGGRVGGGNDTPTPDPFGLDWNRPYATPGGNPNIPAWTDPTGGLYQANWDANRWQGPGLPPNLYQPTYPVFGTPSGPPVTDPNLYDRNGNYRGPIFRSVQTGPATPQAPAWSPPPQAPAWGQPPTAAAGGAAPVGPTLGAAPVGPAFGAAPVGPAFGAAPTLALSSMGPPGLPAATPRAVNPLSAAISRQVAPPFGGPAPAPSLQSGATTEDLTRPRRAMGSFGYGR